jgi:hypothetical protein
MVLSTFDTVVNPTGIFQVTPCPVIKYVPPVSFVKCAISGGVLTEVSFLQPAITAVRRTEAAVNLNIQVSFIVIFFVQTNK